MNQQELVKTVKAKNRASNVMLCLKTVLEICPMVLVVHMVANVFTGTLTTRTIVIDGALMLLCFVLKALCVYGAAWKAHEAAYDSLTDLRLQIISHLKKLPLGFFQERKTGDLTNIVQHDVEQVETYLAHGLPEIMSATLLPVLIFIVMLLLDWRLALLMVAGLPLMWLTKKLAAPVWAKNTKIFSQSVQTMQENLMEYVANIPVIKAFGKEETKTAKTIQSTKDYVYWVKKSMAGVSVPMALIGLFMESGVVLVMIMGTWLLSIGAITLPALILAIILGGTFTATVAKIATFQHFGIVFNQAMAGIGSILNVPVPGRREAGGPVIDGDIEIRGLNFAYQGKEETLRDIDLTIKSGSKNAFVGASGCGKSTLANLLMGFWMPDSGTISVAGVPTTELSEKQLGSLTSIVQQEVFLFNMSMEENIRIGKPDATLPEIMEAAKKARIHDFILSLPRQYQSTAGEAGVKFSGGEKQRIAIARMFLKNAPIVILDEATAAVDTENEAHIQAAIAELGRDKTMITIAHHLGTIRDADQIVVMEDGAIVDKGRHPELMERCGLYSQMVDAQTKVDNWNIREA